jgi:histidinol-phosphate aminotransferase
MQPKQNIVHLPVYQPGKPIEEVKRELGLSHVIKLASNENPFGCSPKAKEAMQAEFANISLYPDGGAVDLTNVLAGQLGVNADQIIFGAGSDDVIMMIARAFLVPGDETVMATHTFGQYKHNAEVEGAVCVEVPLKDGVHDLPAMLAKVNEKTKIVWICNPNNPTGTAVSLDEIERFIQSVPKSVMVVLDEAYYEYLPPAQFSHSIDLVKKYENTVILRTFSKIYGLASLRIGYGVGNPQLIRSVNQVREPFNTNRFAQAAAIASVRDTDFVLQCRKNNDAGRTQLQAAFDRMGLSYYPSFGNFIMVHIGRPAGPVFDALLRKGIIVRGGHQLDFPESLRITIGSQEQNAAFLDALEDALKS